MSKLNDLQTLVRLLDEFKLPVSPILEYAIKEKEEELCSDEKSEVNDDEIEMVVPSLNEPKSSCDYSMLKEEFSGSGDIVRG